MCICLSYVYLLYCVSICALTLDAGLLARSQYPEGPATGHLDKGFSVFLCDDVCRTAVRTAHIFTQKSRTHTKCYAAASPH